MLRDKKKYIIENENYIIENEKYIMVNENYIIENEKFIIFCLQKNTNYGMVYLKQIFISAKKERNLFCSSSGVKWLF